MAIPFKDIHLFSQIEEIKEDLDDILGEFNFQISPMMFDNSNIAYLIAKYKEKTSKEDTLNMGHNLKIGIILKCLYAETMTLWCDRNELFYNKIDRYDCDIKDIKYLIGLSLLKVNKQNPCYIYNLFDIASLFLIDKDRESFKTSIECTNEILKMYYDSIIEKDSLDNKDIIMSKQINIMMEAMKDYVNPAFEKFIKLGETIEKLTSEFEVNFIKDNKINIAKADYVSFLTFDDSIKINDKYDALADEVKDLYKEKIKR